MTSTSTARVVAQVLHGRDRRLLIHPGEFTCTQLAAEMADEWVRICEEVPSAANTLRCAIVHLARSLAPLPGADTLDLTTVRRSHLDRWESELQRQQSESHSDTPYRYAVHVFALLRRIDDTNPGLLHPDVADRCRMPTRLAHIRRPGNVPFSLWERRRLIGAAKRLASGDGPPGVDEIVGLFVLAAHATGEPVEVLRRLRIDDIDVTLPAGTTDAAGIGSVDSLLSIGGSPDAYHLSYVKTRARTIYDATYTRSDRMAHWTFTTLIRRTASLRQQSGSNELWLHVDDAGHPTVPNWASGRLHLKAWAERQLPSPGEAPHQQRVVPAITTPVVYSRFRKHVVAQEALRHPARYFATSRRHSNQTFFDHYASSPVLRAQAGRIVVDAISEMFDAAVTGPTIVTPAAMELMRAGAPAQLPDVDAAALLDGRLNGPLAACKDPSAPPEPEADGGPCSAFANGRCYRCPNAIITVEHLPGVLRIADMLDPARYGRPEEWERAWGATYRFLHEQVLPAFDDADIAAAAERTDGVYLDAALVQEMGGA